MEDNWQVLFSRQSYLCHLTANAPGVGEVLWTGTLICAQAQKGLEVVMETVVGHLHARWVVNGLFMAPLALVKKKGEVRNFI